MPRIVVIVRASPLPASLGFATGPDRALYRAEQGCRDRVEVEEGLA